MLRIDVPDIPAYELEAFQIERRESDLDCPGVVEAWIGGEVHLEPLCQRCQTLNALGSVVEGGCSRDKQVEARESTGVDLVDQLAEGIEALLTHVAADALQRLHLV